MDKFLEIYNLSRLNYEELKNLNRPMNSEEIRGNIKLIFEEISKTSSKLKVQMASLVNAIEHSNICYLSFSNSSKKIEEVAVLPNTFCEAIICQILASITHTQKIQTNIADDHRCKNHKQIISKSNTIIYF